jgi:hypothetical protein
MSSPALLLMAAGAAPTAGTGFKTRWTVAGDATARTITLPLTNAGSSSFSCTVDWGDGSAVSTVTAYNDAAAVHTYASNGSYTVEIKGTCEGWSFNNAGDKAKLVAIVDWGTSGTFGGFKYLTYGFHGCSANASLPATGKILVSGAGPTDLSSCFRSNALSGTLPSGMFDNLTAATTLYRCFYGNASLTGIPSGFLDHLTALTTMTGCFTSCNILTIPAGLFDNLTLLTYFDTCFDANVNLRQRSTDLFPSGGESTRFIGKSINFSNCYRRSSFGGTQGTAPDIWNCDFGETLTLDVAPTTDWVAGDVITGQSSGATAVVVSKTSTTPPIYRVKQHFGAFTLGEIIGVTGDSNKLADQGVTRPVVGGTYPTTTGCFSGAGNYLTSLTNYADIPASWR